MKKYTVYQIDSFTTTKFKGNPAGVVVNADGLSENQMLSIARELNNSETAFLLQADDLNCDGVIRYFTPTIEVPICGHATVAAMYAKALEENLDSCILNMKTKIGVLPFEIERRDDGIKVWMTQGPFESSPSLSQDVQLQLLDCLGILQTDLDVRCPIQIVSTGHSKVMIGIKSKEQLNTLMPDFHMLKELSKQIHCNGYFVFTLDAKEPDILSHGRMFAPAIGINEDPVTGNANGPLGGYLIQNKVFQTGNEIFRFNGAQGEAIGRDGIVEVSVSHQNDKVSLVKIGGKAVVVFKTIIEV